MELRTTGFRRVSPTSSRLLTAPGTPPMAFLITLNDVRLYTRFGKGERVWYRCPRGCYTAVNLYYTTAVGVPRRQRRPGSGSSVNTAGPTKTGGGTLGATATDTGGAGSVRDGSLAWYRVGSSVPGR
jgi:hypothetical protein